MEILNIGPLELILILVLALVVFGPERMVDYSKAAARLIRKIIRSPFWRDLVSTSEEIKSIPQQLVKEAHLDESVKEISQLRKSMKHPIRLDVSIEGEAGNTDNSIEPIEAPESRLGSDPTYRDTEGKAGKTSNPVIESEAEKPDVPDK